MINENTRIGYFLGQRDALAGILAETYSTTKLPAVAKLYEARYGRHFSHSWHVDENAGRGNINT